MPARGTAALRRALRRSRAAIRGPARDRRRRASRRNFARRSVSRRNHALRQSRWSVPSVRRRLLFGEGVHRTWRRSESAFQIGEFVHDDVRVRGDDGPPEWSAFVECVSDHRFGAEFPHESHLRRRVRQSGYRMACANQRRGTSRRPTKPVAPATKIRIGSPRTC